MKNNVALIVPLVILSIFTIIIFGLTIALFIDLQHAKDTRQAAGDQSSVAPTPASTTAPPVPTSGPTPATETTTWTGSSTTSTTTSPRPVPSSLASIQFTDEVQPWKPDYANPWSPQYSSLVSYYEMMIKTVLVSSGKAGNVYENSAVTVNSFSGQYLDTGATSTRVHFVIGVDTTVNPDDIATDLQNGAAKNNLDWRGISAENADIAPLPEPDRSVGWTDASRMFLSSLNLSVDPCQDFYRYSCDNYIAAHPLGNAASQSSFGVLQREIYENLTRAFETLDPSVEASKTVQLTGNIFKACTAVTNQTYQGPSIVLDIANDYGGWPVLDPTWDISRVPNNTYWAIGNMFTKYGVPTLFNPSVEVDWDSVASTQLLFMDQAALAIPADYYRNPNLTDRYQNLLRTAIYLTVQALGAKIDNETLLPQIDRMVAIEYNLALISVNGSEQRNMSLGFNRYTIAQAQIDFPQFDWTSFFNGALNPIFSDDPSTLLNPFILDEPRQYARSLNDYLTRVNSDPQSMRDLVNYLIFRLISSYVQFAGPEPAEIMKSIRKQTRLGEIDITDQQYGCVDFLVNNVLYGAGRLYIDYNFPPQNRDAIAVMTNNVLSAFSATLTGLNWMDDQSALKAYNKVTGLIRNVAYPDFQQNDQQLDAYYDQLIKNTQSIKPDDALAYYEYFRQTISFQTWQMWNKLKQPGDRLDFLMSPATVNAWYQPERNSITFPAAILNPPFYRYDFPQAVNYGGLGVVMGHEMSHGFDDQGVQYDSDGTLHTWMTPGSLLGFDQMAQCVVDQYSNFCYPQACINGITTQGENIADNGGIKAAYHAYRAYVASHGDEKPLPGLETFSMDQIFFLSFSQVWCGSSSDDALTRQLLTNPHSPGRDRVIGAVQNFPKFGEAFKCKKGDPMYPVTSCDVW